MRFRKTLVEALAAVVIVRKATRRTVSVCKITRKGRWIRIIDM